MIEKKWIDSAVQAALMEDGTAVDITTQALVDKKTAARAEILAKQELCVCGLEIAAAVFKKLDPRVKIKFFARDGALVPAGRKLMEISGNARAILAAERSALNFMQHLSGVATLAHQFVREVRGTRAKICDTRKTVPGLRALEKYAVRCGGATNHRLNLSDMALVKDNHWKLVGKAEGKILELKKLLEAGAIENISNGTSKNAPKSVSKNLASKKFARTLLLIEVETDRQLDIALNAGADIIMLDNLPAAQMKKAIARIRKAAPRTLIEVSGNVRLNTARAIAKLGVDRISVGALTHSAPAADISLELI